MAPTLMTPAYYSYIPHATMQGPLPGLVPLYSVPVQVPLAQSSPVPTAGSPAPDARLMDMQSPNPYHDPMGQRYAHYVQEGCAASPVPDVSSTGLLDMSSPGPLPFDMGYHVSYVEGCPVTTAAPQMEQAYRPVEMPTASPPLGVAVPVTMPAVVGSAVTSSPQPAAVATGRPVAMPSQAVYPMSVTTQLVFRFYFNHLFYLIDCFI